MSEKIEVELSHARTTPGTYLYTVSDDIKSTAVVQNVYVKKSAFPGTPPTKIKVTVEPA